MSEFHRQRGAPEGRRTLCRDCTRRYNRHWRRHNPEKKKARDRRYGARRKTNRNGPIEGRRERMYARIAVYKAIKAGRLVRPKSCPRCGSTEHAVQAHHEDYSRRLDVTWLCAPCHADEHGRVVA